MIKKKVAKVLNLTAVFESSSEGGYTVTIPALPGCISEGETFEESLDNIQEAAELYLEDLKKNKEEIPSESSLIVAPIKVRS